MMLESERLMKQLTAPMSASIVAVTAFVFVVAAGMLIAAVHWPVLLIGGGVLSVVSVASFLLAPVSYSIEAGKLVVTSHVHQKVFGPVVRCSRVEALPPLIGIRLFGSGGLFGGMGIFWNRVYGVFRMYVTSARPEDMVLVETADRRIVISPRDPAGFVSGWTEEERVRGEAVNG